MLNHMKNLNHWIESTAHNHLFTQSAVTLNKEPGKMIVDEKKDSEKK